MIDSVEDIEATAWADALAALRERDGQQVGIEVSRGAGRTVLRGRELGGPMFNRILGLGCGANGDDGTTLADDVNAFRARGIRDFFVHVPHGDEADPFRARLVALGLRRYPRSWVKLVRGREALRAVPKTDLAVEIATPGMAAAVAAIFARGFDLPALGGEVFAATIGRKRWHALVALVGEVPVAAAVLFVRDGYGYIAGAATSATHRRRGAQAALLNARIQIALDLGCHTVVTETGEAVPGDPQHSYRNLEKAGFRPVYLRENYAPPDAMWSRER